jgi:hypothetical protein
MSTPARKRPLGDYPVGYGKPPAHGRFRKGQSGNPKGRPRGTGGSGRLTKLVLLEAYRPVVIREGEKTTTVPAIQAVVRSQLTLAAKGNGPAQRAFLGTVSEIEKTEATADAEAERENPPLTDLEVARRLAFILEKGRRELERIERDDGSDS